jgi:hypothetical protein
MASVLSSAVVPAEVERLEMVADVGSCLPTTQLRELPAAQLLELDTDFTVTAACLPSRTSALTLLRLPLLSLLRSLLLNIYGVRFVCAIAEDGLGTRAGALCVMLASHMARGTDHSNTQATSPWTSGASHRRTDSDGGVVAVPVIVLDFHVRGVTEGSSSQRTVNTTS